MSVSKMKPATVLNPIIFHEDDILNDFFEASVQRGRALYKKGKVKTCTVSAYNHKTQKQKISGSVVSSNASKLYRVNLTVESEEDEVLLGGYCSCYVGRDCKHVVALALHALMEYPFASPSQNNISSYDYMQQQLVRQDTSDRTKDLLQQWSTALQASRNRAKAMEEEPAEAIVYILDLTSSNAKGVQLEIRLERSKRLKKGGYGKSKELTFYSFETNALVAPEDRNILGSLYALQENLLLEDAVFASALKNCDAVIEAILATGRAFWVEVSKTPLTQGKKRHLEAGWEIQDSGEQIFELYDKKSGEPVSIQILPTNPGWYCDEANNQLGRINSTVGQEAMVWLLQAPPIKPDVVEQTQRKIIELMPETSKHLPVLQTIASAPPLEENTSPQVMLRLYGESQMQYDPFLALVADQFDDSLASMATIALAELSFNYQGYTVNLAEADDVIDFYEDGLLHKVTRNKVFERQCVDKLEANDLKPAALNPDIIELAGDARFSLVVEAPGEAESQLEQKFSNLQVLANKEGWTLQVDESFPMRIIHEVDDWYTELDEEGSGIDWFGVNIGVLVNEERVNILPLLVEKIETQFRGFDAQAIKQLPNDTPCQLRMKNGEYLQIPFERIRNILLVLFELFEDKPLDDSGKLKLSRLKASLLPEIEKAVGATRLRWLGSSQLKAFGEKLSNFTGIETIAAPVDFTATLRPYQQEGLNWLQFLREFDLNGILADDMGLGKTIQTLAHLCVEKQAQRLSGPSLLIAPTSLMTNWLNEAARFAPNLTVLVLHGAKRKEQFDAIASTDLVLTTYPLVLRDKDVFLEHRYCHLILDEAHQIKNAQAKVTQIILQLRAQHRLCLTGTPMENHLGELWSLFHFILPGLLGTKAEFKRNFQIPVEKRSDSARHQQLVQRIKPFMLRRRKDDVVNDLPAKTEMIRTVALGSEQRDLYESVRLTMEKKVRKAIDSQGMSRSQIIILDALLKLRQICCAPSLLKLQQAQQVAQSAKLEHLMNFLPNLIEEGRRILLFSSFTSMLALIEDQLKQQNIAYVKLTGSTRDRKTPINQFQQRKVPVFLISLKAGGVGLNLTAADTVIHYDPWWNPAAEQQATDRAHRIGQKNPVFVYKLIVEGTVEERILEMQAKKREIVEGVLDANKKASIKLSKKDLDVLFQPIQ